MTERTRGQSSVELAARFIDREGRLGRRRSSLDPGGRAVRLAVMWSVGRAGQDVPNQLIFGEGALGNSIGETLALGSNDALS